ncbi:MAG: hypothetical protein Tsb0010_11800 [Parvularculaceae bacterium]
MKDVLEQLGGYISVGWRNRWLALIVAWAVSLVGWVVVERIPDAYRSSSRVFIDTDSMIRNSMQGIAASFGDSVSTSIAFFRQSLLSRPSLEEIMRRADLDVRAATPEDRERIIEDLRNNLRVASDRESIYTIEYVSQDPGIAQAVVQAVVDRFVETNLGSNREELETTSTFLNNQIDETEADIERTQQTLRRFEIQNRDYLSENNYEVQLRERRSELFRVAGEREQAISRRDDLQEQLDELLEKIRAGDIVDTQLAATTVELEAELARLLSVYTEEHPDVIIIKQRLERERARLQEIVAAGANGAEINNSFVNEIRAAIREEEAKINAADAQSAILRNQIAELETFVARMPTIEIERQRMQRDLQVAQENLQKLIDRREQARFAQRLDVETSIVEFRVIEPPTRPNAPTDPNRLVLRTGVLAAGLGGGGALAIGLGILMGTYSSRAQLIRSVGRPVIGSVRRTTLPSDRPRWFLEAMIFWSAVLALLAAFAVVNFGGLAALRAF